MNIDLTMIGTGAGIVASIYAVIQYYDKRKKQLITDVQIETIEDQTERLQIEYLAKEIEELADRFKIEIDEVFVEIDKLKNKIEGYDSLLIIMESLKKITEIHTEIEKIKMVCRKTHAENKDIFN